jgi:PRTRC genetic system protein F
MITTSSTLPRLDNVPGAVYTGDDGSFAHMLALTLLRGRTITAADAAHVDAGTTDHDLVSEAITRVWQSVVEGHRCFDWHLKVTEQVAEYNIPRGVRLKIGTLNGIGSSPNYALKPGIMRLEKIADGLGETVLAVLYEACHHYLPTVCTPRMSLDIAEYVYWSCHPDEISVLPELRDMYDEPKSTISDEAFIKKHNIPRRAEFFRNCPDWIFRPTQRLPIESIRIIEKWDVFAACVIQACDEIHHLITECGPFPRVDCTDEYGAPLDYAMILRWTSDDSTDRIIDDHYANEMQGDPVDGSCSRLFKFEGTAISTWLRGMANTGRLARAVEGLLDFVASPIGMDEAQQIRVRV